MVTLVLACLFMAAWVRSLFVEDRFEVENTGFVSSVGKMSRTHREYGVTDQGQTYVYSAPGWGVPHGSIVLPLTVLSVWLLLSKTPISLRRHESEA